MNEEAGTSGLKTSPRARLKARLGAWAVVAIGALASPAVLWAGGSEVAAAAWSLAWLSAMGWLLASTPDGAIRLPWWLSGALVVGGAVWLLVAAGAPGERGGQLLALLFGLVLYSLFSLTTEGRRWHGAPNPVAWGSTFWWTALWGWHPLIWLPQAGGEGSGVWMLLGGALILAGHLFQRQTIWFRVVGAALWVGSVAIAMLVV